MQQQECQPSDTHRSPIVNLPLAEWWEEHGPRRAAPNFGTPVPVRDRPTFAERPGQALGAKGAVGQAAELLTCATNVLFEGADPESCGNLLQPQAW